MSASIPDNSAGRKPFDPGPGIAPCDLGLDVVTRDEELRGLYDALSPLTPEERMAEYKLKADRADVIVPAAEIFLTVAAAVRAKDIIVPVIGLCDGIIDTLYKTDFPG